MFCFVTFIKKRDAFEAMKISIGLFYREIESLGKSAYAIYHVCNTVFNFFTHFVIGFVFAKIGYFL